MISTHVIVIAPQEIIISIRSNHVWHRNITDNNPRITVHQKADAAHSNLLCGSTLFNHLIVQRATITVQTVEEVE